MGILMKAQIHKAMDIGIEDQRHGKSVFLGVFTCSWRFFFMMEDMYEEFRIKKAFLSISLLQSL